MTFSYLPNGKVQCECCLQNEAKLIGYWQDEPVGYCAPCFVYDFGVQALPDVKETEGA